MKTITIKQVVHRNEDRISLSFDYDQKLAAMVRGLPGRKWSRTLKCWHIPYVDNFRQGLALLLPGVNFQECGLPNPVPVSTKTISATVDQRAIILYVKIPYALKNQFKKLEGAWYHPGAKTWSAIDTLDNRQQLQELLTTHNYKIIYTNKELKQKRKPVRSSKKLEKTDPDPRFERMMRLEGKSENTIRQYKSYVCWFLAKNKNIDLQANPTELVRDFLYRQVIGQAYGPSQQNGVISAIKQYYFSVYNIELGVMDIPRPKPKRKLPKVISEAEFKLMANATKNPKHKLILMLLYGCGLRRKEVCELKVGDIDFERELILVKGKGDKFRVINPGNKLLVVLKKYIKSHLPETYLIEGVDKNAYSGTSVGMIVSRAAENAKIKRHVHPHMLRHSFATHHMERGIELRLIQETLGHVSSRTTEIYTHVSRKAIKKMPNLLDGLNF